MWEEEIDIIIIFIAQKNRSVMLTATCIQDRNNRIKMLTRLWLFASFCTNSMLTLCYF